MSWLSSTVNNIVGDSIAGGVKAIGGKVQDVASSKAVVTALPVVGLYTQQGRQTLLNTYGRVATGVLSSYTGGAAAPVAGGLFNLAGAIPGVLPSQEPQAARDSSSGGSGGGYAYQGPSAAGGKLSSTTLALIGGGAALLLIVALVLRK